MIKNDQSIESDTLGLSLIRARFLSVISLVANQGQFIRLTPFKLLKHNLLLYLPLVTYGLQCPLPHSPMHPPQFLEILHSAIPCFETNSVLFCEGNDPNTRRHSDISIRGPICHDSWHFFSNLLLFHIAQTFKFQKIVDFSQLNRFPL